MSMTLMACYGAGAYDDCYGNDCGAGWCTSNYDCPTGSYCGDLGYCEWGGECTDDQQCSDGWTCDESAQTCVPEVGCELGGCDPGSYCELDTDTCEPGCDENEDCGGGFSCTDNHICAPEATCGEEVGCAQGSTCSDENTCLPCETDDCAGGCFEAPETPPLPAMCPDGQVPAVLEGHLTGECIQTDHCAQLSCPELDEDSCIAVAECEAFFIGIHCTDENGEACTSASSNCQCEAFEFDRCEPHPPMDAP